MTVIDTPSAIAIADLAARHRIATLAAAEHPRAVRSRRDGRGSTRRPAEPRGPDLPDLDLRGLEPVVDTPAGPVWLRPTTASDVGLLGGLLERLSPESRRRRFFTPMPTVPAALVRQLCEVDGCRQISWLAHDGSGAVAEARCVRPASDPTSADLAVMVADDRHGQGLGRVMVAAALVALDALGVSTVTCDVLYENRISARLFGSFGLRFRPDSGTLAGLGAMADARRAAARAGIDVDAVAALAAGASRCAEERCTAPAVQRLVRHTDAAPGAGPRDGSAGRAA